LSLFSPLWFFVVTLYKAPILEPVLLAGPSRREVIYLASKSGFFFASLFECNKKA
jgi:hypothetical protein